jgi:hypothetical protein
MKNIDTENTYNFFPEVEHFGASYECGCGY